MAKKSQKQAEVKEEKVVAEEVGITKAQPEDVIDATTGEVTKQIIATPKEEFVFIVEDCKPFILGTFYTFKKGQRYKVPAEVARILRNSGKAR